MQPIGIGVLGCGNISRIHADAIARVPALKLVSVCSRSAASAEKLASQFRVAAHANLGAFLADRSLEAVTICTPSGTHAELGCAAALAGKHVLVEKPIDVTLEKTDDLIKICAQSGIQLGVSLQSRFLDAPRALRKAVHESRLGRLVMASAYIKWYRTDQYYASAAWRGTLALDGGGALINQAIHTVDLLQWIAGPVAEVHAYSGKLLHPQIEGEDTIVATLRFRNGALGVIEAATSVYPGFKRRLEITGTEGTAVLDGDNISTWAPKDGSPNPAPPSGEVTDGSSNAMAIDSEGHRRVMEDFAQAIQEGCKLVVDGIEGRRALELVLAVYKSARLGKAVAL
ncbi:MAG TPA: Gfo/Idh/MocA family oxidoreductase [Acidobacteriota bacterium]|nr:Gfo/Idh/MocA family oxidoreductase [Acidobacteriota bacterium]